jgi:excisionase family DNA binding protein
MPRLLMTVRQVAEMLSVRPSTVYEWARIRYIPSVQLGSGSRKPCVRFDQVEIDRWLEARKKAGRTSRLPPQLLDD